MIGCFFAFGLFDHPHVRELMNAILRHPDVVIANCFVCGDERIHPENVPMHKRIDKACLFHDTHHLRTLGKVGGMISNRMLTQAMKCNRSALIIFGMHAVEVTQDDVDTGCEILDATGKVLELSDANALTRVIEMSHAHPQWFVVADVNCRLQTSTLNFVLFGGEQRSGRGENRMPTQQGIAKT